MKLWLVNGRLAIAVVACALSCAAMAQEVAGVFGKGRTHAVVTAGTGYAFDESYLVLGAGITYYVVDGLGVGLFFESWSGADPGMTKITPSVQYVFHQMQALKPYVGAFYRRTDIDGLPDLDSVGARAGVYLRAGRNVYFGLGVVYESYLDCEKAIYRECDSTYGELSFTLAF